MSGQPVPTLDTNGWLSGVAERCDALMAYLLTSDASQSNMLFGKIRSIPSILQKYSNNPDALRTNMRAEVFALFNAYFDGVDVQIDLNYNPTSTGQSSARIDIQITVIVTDDGTRHSLGRELKVVNNRVSAITVLHTS